MASLAIPSQVYPAKLNLTKPLTGQHRTNTIMISQQISKSNSWSFLALYGWIVILERSCTTYHIDPLRTKIAISCAELHCHSKHPPWRVRGSPHSPHCYCPWWSLQKTPITMLWSEIPCRHTLPHGPFTHAETVGWWGCPEMWSAQGNKFHSGVSGCKTAMFALLWGDQIDAQVNMLTHSKCRHRECVWDKFPAKLHVNIW